MDKSDFSRYSTRSNVKYISRAMFHYNRRYPFYYIVNTLTAFVGPLVAAVIPSIVIALVMDNVSFEQFVLVMTASVIVYAVLTIANIYMSHKIEEQNYFTANKEVQNRTVRKILYTDYANIENSDNQELIDIATDSYSVEWQGWRRTMDSFTQGLFTILGMLVYGIILIRVCPWILLVFAVTAVLNVSLERYALKASGRHWGIISESGHKVSYFFNRSTSAADGKDIRMYRMEQWFESIMTGLVKKRMTVWKKVEFPYFYSNISDTILSMVRDIVAYSILIGLFIKGEIDAATFTLYMGIINGFAGWLNGRNTYGGFTRALCEILRCKFSITGYRLFDSLDDNNENKDENNAVLDCTNGFTVEFRDVCFAYPDTDKNIINHLNLTIHSGEKIALVGVNGAGKTTLVKLLCGFYHPSSGQIIVNGRPITEYSLDTYQKCVGAVFQDMMVVAASVAENVACTSIDQIDMDRLNACINRVGLATKINSLEKGVMTSVTNFIDKDGVMFSGGETQKMLLARALYKDAPLLLLDEPTSALDPLAEAALYEQYNNLAEDKTAVFISHRLASTKFCSRILLFNNGHVEEDGTHEELIKNGKAYAEMFRIQSIYYKSEDKNEEVTGNEE